MKLGETEPTARRIGPIPCVDDNGDPVIDDFSGGGEKEISVNDGPFAAALGDVEIIGDGYAYYQATEDDAMVQGFVVIKLSGVCQESTFREEVESAPQGIPVGTEDENFLHVGPCRVVDDNGDPLSVIDDVEIKTSINGRPWDNAGGTAFLFADGYVDYVPPAAEVEEIGWMAVKLTGACQEVVFRSTIVGDSSESGDTTPPSVSIVSPTPGVAIGEAGGFSKSYEVARATPIILEITDLSPGIRYLSVVARFYADAEDENPTEEVVYRRSNFRGLYVRGSSKAIIDDGLRLSIRRLGGWPSNSAGNVGHIVFAIDAVDQNGNLL